MIPLVVALVLLLGNGFFVGAEFALIAARRTVVEPMAATSARARAAIRAMNDIPLMVAGAQLGITICSLGLGAIAEPAIAHLLEGPFTSIGLPESAVHPVAFTLGLIVVVYLHTVIGEMVPKNLTLAGPEAAVLWLGPPMLWFCLATRPVLVALKWVARSVLRLWRIEAEDAVKTVYTADELANLVTQARSEGLLEPEEYARIEGALALRTRTAADAMRPWAEITTVPLDVSPAYLELLASRTGRSRFPVVHAPTRRVVGFVHVKDVIGLPGRLAPIPVRLIRRLDVVSPQRTLGDLLLAMRRNRRHMVLVSDGQRPLGVLTLHDVLGVLVPAAPATSNAPAALSAPGGAAASVRESDVV
jgi:CBS domain containing-hemolysin-like protein